MAEQATQQNKKTPLCAALLAHVGASRREPHFHSHIPGPKTGDFSRPAAIKLFQGLKIPPYVVVLEEKTAAYGGQYLRFGPVAVFRAENEVGTQRFLLATKANPKTDGGSPPPVHVNPALLYF